MTYPKSILFVCLGNICRSPSAEAVMRAKCQHQHLSIQLDSAGTANYHIGSPPDKRAITVGSRLGYRLVDLKARQVCVDDFYHFDVIFAMDKQNLANLQRIMPTDSIAQVLLFDDFDKNDVADPYYGDERDFVAMYTHIDSVVDKWLIKWQGEMV